MAKGKETLGATQSYPYFNPPSLIAASVVAVGVDLVVPLLVGPARVSQSNPAIGFGHFHGYFFSCFFFLSFVII